MPETAKGPVFLDYLIIYVEHTANLCASQSAIFPHIKCHKRHVFSSEMAPTKAINFARALSEFIYFAYANQRVSPLISVSEENKEMLQL